jgi:prolyl-tRNA synthetase
MIGALIMMHSDDDGLVCPPRVAPQQIVIIPVTPKADTADQIISHCKELAAELLKVSFHGTPLRVLVDTRDLNGGTKKWEWVKKGVPVRIEIGPRDLEKGSVCLQRRDQAPNAKSFTAETELKENIASILDEIQNGLLERAIAFRDSHIRTASTLKELEDNFAGEGDADWLLVPWDATPEEEEELAKKHRISIRCIPHGEMGSGPLAPCILTGKMTTKRVLWARSY